MTVYRSWDELYGRVRNGQEMVQAPTLPPLPTEPPLPPSLGCVIAADEPARPAIVCLCGSTRFYEAFQQANYDETMAGRIVLSVGFYPHAKAEHGHGEGVGHDSAEKVALDELHKRKIDLADEVLVLNVGGYVGDSTRSEIAYAVAAGKAVRWLETAEPTDGPR